MRPGPTSLGPFDPGYRALPAALPIFPLTGAVLLPGGRLPLNIFEPRYLAMTRHALLQPTRLIGMVQPVEQGADRDPDATARPAVQRIGCAGRMVSFQETEEGRYLITLSGLIRFAIKRELPLHEGGFRLVEPDFTPFAEDMAERDFEMAAKARILRRLQRLCRDQAAEGRLGGDQGRARRSPAGVARHAVAVLAGGEAEPAGMRRPCAAGGDDDGVVRARGRQPAIARPHLALRDYPP